jgi:hypothetical protein
MIRVHDTSSRERRISSEFVRDSFGAHPVVSAKTMDLLQLRDLMKEMLQSQGGRPSLANSTDRVKVPKLASDWATIERITDRLGPQLVFKPSPAQVAAVMLHWAVTHMNDEDIRQAMTV